MRWNGGFGLVGYLVLSTCYLLMACVDVHLPVILPQLAATDATYVISLGCSVGQRPAQMRHAYPLPDVVGEPRTTARAGAE